MSKNKTLFIGFFMGIVFTFAILYLSGFVPKTGNYELIVLNGPEKNGSMKSFTIQKRGKSFREKQTLLGRWRPAAVSFNIDRGNQNPIRSRWSKEQNKRVIIDNL